MIIIPKLFFRLRKAIDESPNCLFQSLIALRGLLENPRFSLMIFRFTVNHINYIYMVFKYNLQTGRGKNDQQNEINPNIQENNKPMATP